MAVKRLEVYVDSYRSKPFIMDFDDKIELTPRDEALIEDWIGMCAGRDIEIERNIRVEDVSHHFLESVESAIHSTCVRISLVDC